MRLRSRLVSVALLLTSGFAISTIAPRAAAAADTDLIGTWYVLVHYRDEATANPDADRWEDRVWTFQKKGSRLEWTEYPIVVFEDSTGRFENLGTPMQSRVLAAWEPNEGQRGQIEKGLRTNSRGVKAKTLRGSPERGYESFGQLRAVSASVVGYHETWRIQPGEMPVFTRDDVLGTGRSQKAGNEEALEGRTQYITQEIREDGELRGSFSRDQTRSGVFRMMRAGPVQGLSTDGKTPNEKQAERIQQEIVRETERRLKEGDPEVVREVKEGLRQSRERRP